MFFNSIYTRREKYFDGQLLAFYFFHAAFLEFIRRYFFIYPNYSSFTDELVDSLADYLLSNSSKLH